MGDSGAQGLVGAPSAIAALAALSAAGSPDTAELLRLARQALAGHRAELTLVDDQASRWTNAAAGTVLPDRPLVPHAGELWNELLSRRSARVIEQDGHPGVRACGATVLLCAPLQVHGELTGILAVARDGRTRPTEDDDGYVLTTVAQLVALSLGSATLTARLRAELHDRAHDARRDTLTGLANRAAFEAEVDAALIRVNSALAGPDPYAAGLLLVGINRFKDINASLGHQVGDAVMVAVGDRLLRALPAEATLARFGGDEFAVLLPRVEHPDHAVESARGLMDAVSGIVEVDTVSVPVDVAIGVTVAPLHGGSRAVLLRRADVAMYAAKEHRESAVELYAPEHEHVSTRQLSLVTDLRRALEHGDLAVHYQPKSTIETNQVVGVEALVRWKHQHLGDVSPDELIPLAEHTGLITEVTRFVLRTALEQCATWHRQGMPLHVAVNLSARALRDPELPNEIASALRAANLPAAALTLEITESQFTGDSLVSRRVLAELRRLGVRLSIDDFGTGYSALAYLARLDVDELKIDKSFVMAMGTSDANLAIVRAVVEVAESLGLCTVAEGVEDQTAWDQLSVLGCTTAQGYHLSRPLPGESMGMWLWERRREAAAARHRKRAVGHSSSHT